MKKIISICAKILLTLVVLVGVGLLALGYFANPERIKPMVISHVQKTYNRTLDIGTIHWRVFPRLGISMADIKLSNNPSFGTGTFAAFKDVSVFVDTLSLLSGKLNVKTIRVAGPSANLQSNATGKNNWSDLTRPVDSTPTPVKTAPADKTAPAPTKDDASSLLSSFEFNIDSIEITDGSFKYVDDKSGEKYELTAMNFKSNNVALNKEFPVTLKFSVKSNAPDVIADIDTKATMLVTSKNNRYDLSAISLIGDLSIPNLKANGLTVSSLNSKMKLQDSVLNLSSMSARLYGGTFNGGVMINAKQEPADVSVNYDLRGTDIASLLKDLNGSNNFTGKLNMKGDLRFRSFPEKKQMMQTLNGSANMNIDRGTLKGVDLGYWYSMGNNLLASAKNGIGSGLGKMVAGQPNTGKTDFYEARANVMIDRGLLTNKDFIVYNASIYGAGAGNVDLIQEQINYRFQIQGVKLNGSSAVPVGEVIPLQISGSLDNPKLGLDMKVVQKQVIQDVGTQLFKSLLK